MRQVVSPSVPWFVFLLFASFLSPPQAAAQTTLVVTTAASGTTVNGCDADCTLLDAINASNATTGTVETITFNIPNSGVQTIFTNAGFSITQSVILDATTQPGYTNTPLIEIRPSTPSLSYGFRVLNLSVFGYDPNLTVTIRGFAIGGFTSGLGIQVGNGQNHLIENNHIGVNAAGTAEVPNDRGLLLWARNSTIRGNVISGNNGTGLYLSNSGDRLSFGNSIVGNYIGTNRSGTAILANQNGIHLDGGAYNNTIGGLTLADRNIISGNTLYGIIISGSDEFASLNSNNNTIRGNYIGTDVTGTVDLGNGGAGVQIERADENNIGGTSGVTPDGSCTGACNLISGNNGGGIVIASVITGIAENNVMIGNFIGTDVTGILPLGNAAGISIQGRTNTIGGTTSAERNLISANGGTGISLYGFETYGNVITGNYIGTDTTGLNPLGNSGAGIVLNGGTYANLIGDSTDEGANWIGYNTGAGIEVRDQGGGGFYAGQNIISGNSIFANGGLGIDLLPSGVTPNDAGDVDNGPAGLQNFPVITAIVTTENESTISGTLNSIASHEFALDLYVVTECDTSGYGEGEFYLGGVPVTTDASGFAAFEVVFDPPLPGDVILTATAIDNDSDPNSLTVWNTSEFSACKQAQADLRVSITDTPDPVQVDSFLTYLITVSNFGPDIAAGVTLTDTLPANVTLIDARSTQGICTPGVGTVTCA
ncbi:MAG: right-handed parallel beta-helix repeat-containing protein, partial [Anaerolineae bacterium]|nr:right-handed parallel beta-helix repeat-containing protein [Anaerolineae bacterium]